MAEKAAYIAGFSASLLAAGLLAGCGAAHRAPIRTAAHPPGFLAVRVSPAGRPLPWTAPRGLGPPSRPTPPLHAPSLGSPGPLNCDVQASSCSITPCRYFVQAQVVVPRSPRVPCARATPHVLHVSDGAATFRPGTS